MAKVKTEIKAQVLPIKIRKQTHLYLQDKLLKSIPPNANCQHLTSLYLHDNQIEEIVRLDKAINLRNLYLQNNKIKKIENLDSLKSLSKLFLGNNQISVVENLEQLRLEELYLEKQQLKQGDVLCFDPRTVITLSKSLQVLNISHNNMSSMSAISPLRFLKVFIASHNKINSIEDILNSMKYWYYLIETTFMGNPVAKKHRYRENIIGCCVRLEMLDHKQISEQTRCFIRRFEREMANKPTKSINLADRYPELPKNYSHALQKAVSSSIIKTTLSGPSIGAPDQKYIPWNALPRNLPKRIVKQNKSGLS